MRVSPSWHYFNVGKAAVRPMKWGLRTKTLNEVYTKFELQYQIWLVSEDETKFNLRTDSNLDISTQNLSKMLQKKYLPGLNQEPVRNGFIFKLVTLSF